MYKKKQLIYLFAIIIPFVFASCNDDDDTEKQWKSANDAAYNAVVTGRDTSAVEWKEIMDNPPGVPEGVYYGVIRKGEGTEHPLQTAYVKVLYKGYYYNGNTFDVGTTGTTYISVNSLSSSSPGDPDVVYLLWEGDKYTTYIWLEGEQKFQQQDFNIGTSFLVNGVVRGFGIALQNMVVGDKWKICIPYHLGYGATGNSTITGYSTLFFDVELLEIEQYP